MIEDITDRKHQEDELQVTQQRLEATNAKLTTLARTDALTGCMNRHAFNVEQWVRLADERMYQRKNQPQNCQ